METQSPVREVEMDCPECGFGSLKMTLKPFLRLYNNKLFTIPRSLCFVCDTCAYVEFDEAAYEMIYDMIAGATRSASQTSTASSLAMFLGIEDEFDSGHSQITC